MIDLCARKKTQDRTKLRKQGRPPLSPFCRPQSSLISFRTAKKSERFVSFLCRPKYTFCKGGNRWRESHRQQQRERERRETSKRVIGIRVDSSPFKMDILENKEILIPISMAILLGRTHEGISKRFHLYLWEWLREPAPARGLPEACPVSEWKGIANPLIAGAVCRRIESRDSKQGRLSSLETGWKNCRAASLREKGRKEGSRISGYKASRRKKKGYRNGSKTTKLCCGSGFRAAGLHCRQEERNKRAMAL